MRGLLLRFVKAIARAVIAAQSQTYEGLSVAPQKRRPYDVRDAYPDSVKSFHRRFPDNPFTHAWKLIDSGVATRWAFHGGSCPIQVPRTAGDPVTVGVIWNRYGEDIKKWCAFYQVPEELVIATIATESSGGAGARREEPGYVSDLETPHRVSVGLMQTLLSTAQETLHMSEIDAAWLEDPGNSIQAGVAYIARQSELTNYDPPLVAAGYNAGGLYPNRNAHNPWGLRCYPINTGEHISRYVKWFNDAVAMLRDELA